MRKVIVNSSPLIALANIDQLNLLEKLYQKIIIPNGVYDELNGKGKFISLDLKKCKFIKIEKIKNIEAKKVFQANLHNGEVEVIILYNEINADLCIIDDLLARKYAFYLGYQVTGTLGVLMRAKEKGIIENVKPLLNMMINNNIFIGNELFQIVMELAGEK